MFSAALSPSLPDAQIGLWLLGARQQADRVDPLVDSPPSIVDEKAKYDRNHYEWQARQGPPGKSAQAQNDDEQIVAEEYKIDFGLGLPKLGRGS